MLKLEFRLKAETRTCYRFETGTAPEQMTLYLKKAQVDAAKIDPKKGIVVTVEQNDREDT